MTKKQLVELVARKGHLTKRAANEAIDVFLEELGRVLSKGEKVVLSGFGTFYTVSFQGRTVKLPGSTKTASVKTHRTPKFTAGKKLKKQVK